MTKVSIVTISFNQVQFLERAMKSVLAQDYPDIEYIVVDAGSTDGSRELIDSYRERLTKVIFEPDAGPADGLNKGLANASGEICGYLNADDTYLPGAVRAAVEAFRCNPSVDVIYSHGFIVNGDGQLVRRFRSTKISRWRYLHGIAVVMQQSTFFRREVWALSQGFNVKNRTCWDAEFLVDLLNASRRFKRVRGTWSTFTIHDESISGSQRTQDDYRQTQRRLRAQLGGPQRSMTANHDRLMRIIKWVEDPIGFVWLITDRFRLRRTARFHNPKPD